MERVYWNKNNLSPQYIITSTNIHHFQNRETGLESQLNSLQPASILHGIQEMTTQLKLSFRCLTHSRPLQGSPLTTAELRVPFILQNAGSARATAEELTKPQTG